MYLAGEDANVFIERVEGANITRRQSGSAAAAGCRDAPRGRCGCSRRARCHCGQLTLLKHQCQQRKHWMPVCPCVHIRMAVQVK